MIFLKNTIEFTISVLGIIESQFLIAINYVYVEIYLTPIYYISFDLLNTRWEVPRCVKLQACLGYETYTLAR